MPRLAQFDLPATAIVSQSEMEGQVKQPSGTDTTLLALLVNAAAEAMEGYLRRSLIERSLTMWWDAHELSAELTLWRPPVSAVASVTGYLQDDSTSAVSSSNYVVTDDGRIRLKTYTGAVWPTVMRPVDSLKVVYTAGYGSAASDVPDAIRQGVAMLAARLYEERVPEREDLGGGADGTAIIIPRDIRAIVDRYRNWSW